MILDVLKILDPCDIEALAQVYWDHARKYD